LTVENTQNELPLGGVEQPSQRTPGGGGCQHTPNGGSSEMHDWGGVCTKSRGFMDPRRGGVEKSLLDLRSHGNSTCVGNNVPVIIVSKSSVPCNDVVLYLFNSFKIYIMIF